MGRSVADGGGNHRTAGDAALQDPEALSVEVRQAAAALAARLG